jgi:hypothetical protein
MNEDEMRDKRLRANKALDAARAAAIAAGRTHWSFVVDEDDRVMRDIIASW